MDNVFAVPFDDDSAFEVVAVSPIRESGIYGGYRVMLNAKIDMLLTPLCIGVSTCNATTPHAVRYNFAAVLDGNRSYEVWAYIVETVMAEKVENILRGDGFNTDPRDFYNAYILSTTQDCDRAIFADALCATADQHDMTRQIVEVPLSPRSIEKSPALGTM